MTNPKTPQSPELYGIQMLRALLGLHRQIWVVPFTVLVAVVIAIGTHLVVKRPVLAIIRSVTTRGPRRITTPAPGISVKY